MILLSHPTGNEFVRNAALGLFEAGLLKEFWTCFAWDDTKWINRLIPSQFRKQLKRRSMPLAIKDITKTHPWREVARLLAARMNFERLIRHEKGALSVDTVYRSLDRKVARRIKGISDLKAVYSYEDAAVETFQQAHDLGIKCVYELCIGYWRAARALYREEAELEPEWAATLEGNFDSNEKLCRKDKEIGLADLVIVPSSFVKRTLKMAEGLKAPIEVVSFGAPEALYQPSNKQAGKRLRVIFVGSLTQRKGLSYLFKATSALNSCVSLTVIGKKGSSICPALEKFLNTCRWIPTLPHQEILGEMRQHDVLVLPSICEGFSLVILEAMSQGLPVIITPNTGGEDVVSNGEDGFVIPIRSSDAIIENLQLLYERKELLFAMSKAAYKKACSCSWSNYQHRIVEIVKTVLR